MELSCEERQAAIELPALEEMKKRGDMIKVYKFLNRSDEINTEQFLKLEMPD